jgi:hypothetical protein
MPKKKIVKTVANSFPLKVSSEYKEAERACIADPDQHPERLLLAVKNSNNAFKNTKLPPNTVVQMIADAKQEAQEFCKEDRSKMENYNAVLPKIEAIFQSMKQEIPLYQKKRK